MNAKGAPSGTVNTPAGIHLIADFWGGAVIESPQELEETLRVAAGLAGSVPVGVTSRKFESQGITGVILLEESHISIHTWPEIGYTAIDIFTCGAKTTPDKALHYLQEVFAPEETQIVEIKRGVRTEQR